MKGTTFLRPYELCLEIDGEKWLQGDKIKGEISLKCHSDGSEIITNLNIMLVHGLFKNIKNSKTDSLNIISSQILGENIEVDSKNDFKKDWEFKLEQDAPITDKNGSLYVFYGIGDDLSSYGSLQLEVDLVEELTNYLKVFEDFIRFKVHHKKYKKGLTEVRLLPPKTQELGSLEYLTCFLRLVDRNIEIKYIFKTKKIQATVGMEFEVIKTEKEFNQILTPDDYLRYGNAVNHDGIKKSINEIIANIIPKVVF